LQRLSQAKVDWSCSEDDGTWRVISFGFEAKHVLIELGRGCQIPNLQGDE
jgi:hypothetical protein